MEAAVEFFEIVPNNNTNINTNNICSNKNSNDLLKFRSISNEKIKIVIPSNKFGIKSFN